MRFEVHEQMPSFTPTKKVHECETRDEALAFIDAVAEHDEVMLLIENLEDRRIINYV